ncbi:outer membrane protein assembly factor BamA [Falsigemmobacter intermedius]|nr:outer membrane protein assembly factor BamA [Falsigemmobacter intermedius]
MSGLFSKRATGKSAMRLRSCLLASVMAAGSVAAIVPVVAYAQAYSFSNVTIEGNQRVDARTILGHAKINRGRSLSAAEMNDVYQRLMNAGLFESVNLQPRGNTLVISVKELPAISVVNFEGNKRLKSEDLLKGISSKPRRFYSPATAEADAAAIAEAYFSTARIAARVEPKVIPRGNNAVDLVFEIAEGRVSEVERLSFVGNRNFTDRRLRQVLQTKQAGLLRAIISRDTYNADRIEIDKQLLRDFYHSRGYIDMQVQDATAEMAREQDGFFVTFTVREGLQYRFGTTRVISEIEGLDTSEFSSLLRLKPGAVYSPSDVESAIARMESLAGRKGINFLRVEPRINRDERNRVLNVDFALTRGERIFVERIDIEGNTTTSDEVIRRQFRTVEGDPLNAREVREAAERIRALGYFETANVEASEGSTPESVIVKATVEEKPTGSLSFGASYGKADGVGLTVGLSESNFLGRGQYVAVDLNLGAKNATSSFTFSDPSVLDRDLKFTFAGLYEQTEANYSTWDSRTVQLASSLEFPLAENTRLATRITVGKSGIRNVAGDPATGLPATGILAEEAEGGSKIYAGPGYTLSFDNRRDGLQGRTAYVFRLSQDFFGLSSDLKYLKTEIFAGSETKFFNGDLRLRAELEAGAVHARGGTDLRVLERFFMGDKMRGFEPFGMGPRDVSNGRSDPLGGNYYAVARLEADFPLGLPEEYKMRGAAFFDVGSVWGLDNTTSGGVTVDDSRKLRSSVGVSLLWDTPMGPLRFNLAKALKQAEGDKEQRFDISISTKF